MNTNIWNSSQMAGTGGALKALAKNLANQLNLNRSEMKRVVARVISESHGQGNVGDYNGHMFYVKPERIDLTEQITQSKEAFDEMLMQKRMRTRKPLDRSPSGSRSLTYKLTVGDKPEKSITGVIIDQNHLRMRPNTTDIVVEMSKPMGLAFARSRQLIKRTLPATCIKKQLKRSTTGARPATLCKRRSSIKPQKKSRAARLQRPMVISKAHMRAAKPVQISSTKVPQSRHQLQAVKSRLPAGDGARPAMFAAKPQARFKNNAVPSRIVGERSSILKNNKGAKPAQSKQQCHINRQIFEDKVKKRLGRLAAGGIALKSNRSAILQANKRQNVPWRTPYKFQSTAGVVYRPTPSHHNNYNSSNTRQKAKSRNQKQPKSVKSNKQMLAASNSRRMWLRRSQDRLAQDLEREEAIDEPERLSFRPSLHRFTFCEPPKPKPKRPYKISARLQELALPALHRRFIPVPEPVRSRPPVFKPKLKMKSRRRRRRVLVDSSLGSLEGMRPSSRSGLSPAKRNLTLAFLNKETTRSPRNRRSVLWR